jgi:NAD(P) transhydrogenase subunit alpha
MIIGVPKERVPGERRVALVPESAARLAKAGHEVRVESGAGAAAFLSDEEYAKAGARPVSDPWSGAQIVLKVRGPDPDEIERMAAGCVLVGALAPFESRATIEKIAARGLTAFALEFLPRTSLAQSMDVLSSMSSIAGYKAVLMAAERLPKYFPMLTTAAGTVPPARVFVIGAGVAGLQAIATAKRLGALVEAYDVRPAVKEQVESLGARFVQLEIETKDAQDAGGYAKEQSADQVRRQQELMAKTVARADVVITTALIPGRPAPRLVSAEMVGQMRPGSVVVDLAAEAGGNCELTRPGAEVVRDGVTICGQVNLPSALAVDASRLYSRNITSFLTYLVKNGGIGLNLGDEIVRETLLTHEGKVVHPRLAPPAAPA